MKWNDLNLPTSAENLACDEALLDACDAGGDEVLRCWEAREHFVVVGYANKLHREVNLDNARALGVPVLRRCSGGGTVVQGPGCLNYSLVLKIPAAGPLTAIASTNRHIMERLRDAVRPLLGDGGTVAVRGFTDLVVGERKFSGNAQRRRRHAFLFHGTFLLDFDLPVIERVLRLPSHQPEYRRDRSHRDFLVNLHLPAEKIKAALREQWQANDTDFVAPHPAIVELVKAKYATKAWNEKF